MNEQKFKQHLDRLEELSGNDLQDYLEKFSDEPEVVSILEGEEFDDIGLGKKTVHSVAERVYGSFEPKPSVTEALDEATTSTSQEAGVSIDQLYLDLEMLDSKSGNDQKDFLEQMFRDYKHPEVVSFAVLNDWSLGFGSSTLAKAFDCRDSQPFYENVAAIVRDDDPIEGPEVGRSFEPMLAVPESRGMPDNPVAQRKVDGYRIIIHVSDDSVKAYSRRQNDVTASLPELQEIDWPNGEYILDGEVIAESGKYSDTSERVGRSAENVERDVEMNFALFDLLVKNGDNITAAPYAQRYMKLLEVEAMTEDDRTEVIPVNSDIEQAKDEAIEAGEEGIIVKDAQAPYEFGKRSSSWQKQKFDAETADVVVTAVLEGDKKNTGTMGKLSIESADGVPLGNTGSGFSDEERDEIWANPDEWVGRTIEVEARGLDDKLRMPIYKRDRSDDGEPDPIDRITEIMPEV